MIERDHKQLSVVAQCNLLKTNRSTIYYEQKLVDSNDATIIEQITKIYEKLPFYGYRRLHVELAKEGYKHNLKKTRRLKQVSGLKTIYPSKKTTIANQAHKKYPYLLKGKQIGRPNQVWQVDITYVKIRYGFVYLTCLIDVFSRKLMGWALSPFLDTGPCLEAMKMALKVATPEIINSDQGCQFTCREWVEALQANSITISMDGKGRWADNIFIERLWRTIKNELIYLHSFESIEELSIAFMDYAVFYNSRRWHQSLNYKAPDEVYDDYYFKKQEQREAASLYVSPVEQNSQVQPNFLS